MEHPQEGAQNVQGAAAESTASLARLAVQAVLGTRIGGDTGLLIRPGGALPPEKP